MALAIRGSAYPAGTRVTLTLLSGFTYVVSRLEERHDVYEIGLSG